MYIRNKTRRSRRKEMGIKDRRERDSPEEMTLMRVSFWRTYQHPIPTQHHHHHHHQHYYNLFQHRGKENGDISLFLMLSRILQVYAFSRSPSRLLSRVYTSHLSFPTVSVLSDKCISHTHTHIPYTYIIPCMYIYIPQCERVHTYIRFDRSRLWGKASGRAPSAS